MPVHLYPLSDIDLQKLLPGTQYMDPPDGGSVTLLEQLQRMAKDAERYRWLQENAYMEFPCNSPRLPGWEKTHTDAAVDAAMAEQRQIGAA